MSEALFYSGHDATAEKAVGKALSQAAPIMMAYPTLYIELKSLQHSGHEWDADIRVLAVQDDKTDAGKTRHRHRSDPALNYDPKNPEHARSGNPNEWRPIGMKHDAPVAAFRFSNAALAGELPQLPLENITLDSYELSRASEPELRKILLDLEEARKAELKKPDDGPEFEPE